MALKAPEDMSQSVIGKSLHRTMYCVNTVSVIEQTLKYPLRGYFAIL